MKNIQSNRNGFTSVEMLLVIVTLAIIGIAGYFVAKHVDTKTKPTSGSSTTYQTYTATDGSYSLQYPVGWMTANLPSVDTAPPPGVVLSYNTKENYLIPVTEVKTADSPQEYFQTFDQVGATIDTSSNTDINGYTAYYAKTTLGATGYTGSTAYYGIERKGELITLTMLLSNNTGKNNTAYETNLDQIAHSIVFHN